MNLLQVVTPREVCLPTYIGGEVDRKVTKFLVRSPIELFWTAKKVLVPKQNKTYKSRCTVYILFIEKGAV